MMSQAKSMENKRRDDARNKLKKLSCVAIYYLKVPYYENLRYFFSTFITVVD